MISRAKDRLSTLRAHLNGNQNEPSMHVLPALTARSAALEQDFAEVLTPHAQQFLGRLIMHFQKDVEELHLARRQRQIQVDSCRTLDEAYATCKFKSAPENDWTIDPLPTILQDRRVDIGDISPARHEDFVRALNSGAQGVQVDFDDGHCPTWHNTIVGHKNLMHAARGCLAGMASHSTALLLIRPRAWNMNEEHVVVQGSVAPGALFDFGLHMFHSGVRLWKSRRGPFFYLPKLESASEAALWARVFNYTEVELGIPRGTIKATVLIESIFAAFEMDAILYELRHYSSGLNCGMWDYTASILSKFRSFRECTLPDRQNCVSMKSPFLANYMHLLIETCHKRGAPATTGMIPFDFSHVSPTERAAFVDKAKNGKLYEAQAGADGALVYDAALVPVVQEIFESVRQAQAMKRATLESLEARALLDLPAGDVTLHSIRFNLRVVMHYVASWIEGKGVVVVDHCVEDSATAEISRSQVRSFVYSRNLYGLLGSYGNGSSINSLSMAQTKW
ncbi:hypothetical protein AeMF1_001096 [Aphanomyces euteiches]|nr:hypothetical protein AeMF1_001096 [Aphanomyces euteiches]KAH9195201.1 hypothetical protein AeNC1_002837 [Aphanomyces euteiches]